MKKSAETVAAGVPVVPGQTLRMPVEIMLAWMKINDLEILPQYARKPTGGYVVVSRRTEANMALKEMLAQKLELSKKTGEPQSTGKLRHGLEIKVWDFQDGRIGLQLIRDKVYPSGKEWFTVLRHFPVEVNSDEPKQILHEGRFYLKGTLRRVE